MFLAIYAPSYFRALLVPKWASLYARDCCDLQCLGLRIDCERVASTLCLHSLPFSLRNEVDFVVEAHRLLLHSSMLNDLTVACYSVEY